MSGRYKNRVTRTVAVSGAILLATLTGSLTGCAPDRHPYDVSELETRRPEVPLIIPQGDAVSPDTLIEIYFDELMDTETLERGISIEINKKETDLWRNISLIGPVAFDPSTEAKLVLFRSTNGGFISEDGGQYWKFNRDFAYATLSNIYIDPSDPLRYYTMNDTAVLISSDAGITWSPFATDITSSGAPSCLSFDPVAGTRLWLGIKGVGIFVSDDSGENWTSTGSLPNLGSATDITNIQVDPTDGDVIYASSYGRYVYRSLDGGTTWTMERGATGSLGSTTNFNDLILDPVNPNIIYAASSNKGVFRSLDGADNWYPFGPIDSEPCNDLLYNPTDLSVLYSRFATHIYATMDSAQTWTELTLAKPDSTISNFLVDPNNGDRFLLTYSDDMYFSEDGGNSWSPATAIDSTSLAVSGTLSWDVWQDTLTFILVSEEATDTVEIYPYKYSEALARYEAGFSPTAPADTDPEAHHITIDPDEPLLRGWSYRVVVYGAFRDGDWRPGLAPTDKTGMSVETDVINNFTVSDSL